MRHATTSRLAAIAPMLDELRTIDGLTERKPGTFYRRSNAFLHFHEDGEHDLYADVKLHGREFERMRVTTKAEQRKLLVAVRRALVPK